MKIKKAFMFIVCSSVCVFVWIQCIQQTLSFIIIIPSDDVYRNETLHSPSKPIHSGSQTHTPLYPAIRYVSKYLENALLCYVHYTTGNEYLVFIPKRKKTFLFCMTYGIPFRGYIKKLIYTNIFPLCFACKMYIYK